MQPSYPHLTPPPMPLPYIWISRLRTVSDCSCYLITTVSQRRVNVIHIEANHKWEILSLKGLCPVPRSCLSVACLWSVPDQIHQIKWHIYIYGLFSPQEQHRDLKIDLLVRHSDSTSSPVGDLGVLVNLLFCGLFSIKCKIWFNQHSAVLSTVDGQI